MSRSRDFWSRRRAGVEAEELALEAREAEAQDVALAERPDEELLAELNLPEPETLDSADSVRAFLRAELPQRLKTRALRRLWRLNPVLANLDGLVDYGEDYTDAAMVKPNMKTAYQVGKGIVSKILEQEEDEKAVAEDLVAQVSAEEQDVEDLEVAAVTQVAPVAEMNDDPEPTAMPQRRMRFAFDAV